MKVLDYIVFIIYKGRDKELNARGRGTFEDLPRQVLLFHYILQGLWLVPFLIYLLYALISIYIINLEDRITLPLILSPFVFYAISIFVVYKFLKRRYPPERVIALEQKYTDTMTGATAKTIVIVSFFINIIIFSIIIVLNIKKIVES